MWIPTKVPANLSLDGLATSEDTARSKPMLSAVALFKPRANHSRPSTFFEWCAGGRQFRNRIRGGASIDLEACPPRILVAKRLEILGLKCRNLGRIPMIRITEDQVREAVSMPLAMDPRRTNAASTR